MPDFDIKASAPGKILLLGGYSVLERPNPGFVITVNARVHVRVKFLQTNDVKISAPQFGFSGEGTVDQKNGDIKLTVPKELELIKAAVGVPIKYLVGIGAKIPGFYLETKDDKEFAPDTDVTVEGKIAKSGLGSSAAVTVAGVAAALSASKHGSEAIGIDKDLVHKLAQMAHAVATGKVGSGFDIAAATYGSMIYTRYSPSMMSSLPKDYTCDDVIKLTRQKWDYDVAPFKLPDVFKLTFANFLQEGSLTTSFVAKANVMKEKFPEMYMKMIKEINSANIKAIDALKGITKSGLKEDMDEFRAAFETGRMLTKELGSLAGLGIEPDECTKIIESSKAHGAYVAKLPGAGGREALAALSTSPSSEKELHAFLGSLGNMRVLGVSARDSGVMVGNGIHSA